MNIKNLYKNIFIISIMDEYNDRGLSGLVNMGNTCYLNAAVQSLSHVIQLTHYFLDGEWVEDADTSKKEFKMCSEYNRLINGLWEGNCVVKPISFKNVLGELDKRFKGHAQHDSQEVLSSLLDILHNTLSYKVDISYSGEVKNELDKMEVEAIKTWRNHFKKEYSKILEIFYGQFHSKIVCQKCKKYSNNFDPFSLLTLPVTETCFNIYDCFNEFTKNEVLDSNNEWKCEHCKEYSNAIKVLSLWKIPEVLIVVLKRFNYGFFSMKINRKIEFSLDDLDLEKYVDGYNKYNAHYEAFAIINHTGYLGFGHYYSYCKNGNGEWYMFDDSDVTELDKVTHDNAYVILYRRKNK